MKASLALLVALFAAGVSGAQATKISTIYEMPDGRKVVVEESGATHVSFATAAPCEVQGNITASKCVICGPKCRCVTCGCPKKVADKATPRCSVCKDCDCGTTCACDAAKAEREKAQSTKAATATDRTTWLLNLPAIHQLSDGTQVRMTLGESIRAGGTLTDAYVTWAGMTAAEADAVRSVRVATPPIVYPTVTSSYYVAPYSVGPLNAAPMPTSGGYYASSPYGTPAGITPTRSLGLGVSGPLGGGFFAGFQSGGSCVGSR